MVAGAARPPLQSCIDSQGSGAGKLPLPRVTHTRDFAVFFFFETGLLRLLGEDPPQDVLQDLERRLIQWQKQIDDPLLRSEEFTRRQRRYLSAE